MEKQLHEGVGGGVCAVSSAKDFYSFLPWILLGFSSHRIFLQCQGFIFENERRAQEGFFKGLNSSKKTRKKRLNRKRKSIWPKFDCVFHKPPQVLHPLGLAFYCLNSPRLREGRTCSLSVSLHSDFYRNLEYSPRPLLLSASIVSFLIFARYRKDILFLRIW